MISITYIQTVYSSLDIGKTVLSIFLDFRKAFDCVDHSILLAKLYEYGIRVPAYLWFKSYLTNRKQYVSCNGNSSILSDISFGVPQGLFWDPCYLSYILMIYQRLIHSLNLTYSQMTVP